MTPEQLDAIQRPEPERRAAVAYAIRDTLPTRNAWDMADAAIEAAGVPALLAYARDLEARVGRVEALRRDELKRTIYQSHRLNTQVDLQSDRRLQGSQLAWAGYAADAIIAARNGDIAKLKALDADIEGELQDAPSANYEEDNYQAGYIAGLAYAQDSIRAALTATEAQA